MDIKQKPPGKPPRAPDKSIHEIPAKVKEAASRTKEAVSEPEGQNSPTQYAVDQVTEKGETAARKVLGASRPHIRTREQEAASVPDSPPPSDSPAAPVMDKLAPHHPLPREEKGIREKPETSIREKTREVREARRAVSEKPLKQPELPSDQPEKPLPESPELYTRRIRKQAANKQSPIKTRDGLSGSKSANMPQSPHSPRLISRDLHTGRSPSPSASPSGKISPSQTPLQSPEVPVRRFIKQRFASHPGVSAQKVSAKGVKSTIKTAKNSVKAAGRTVKTAGRTVKTTAKAAKTAVQTSARAAQAAKAAAKASAAAVKIAVKAVIAAIKATISAVKALIEIIAAGGWVAVVVILLIALVGVILCSPFGIFTGGASEKATSEIIAQLDGEKEAHIQQLKEEEEPDRTVIRYRGAEDNGEINNWVDILAVYAVKAGLDSDNAATVAEWNEDAVSLLRAVYWDMTGISYEVNPYTVDYDDGSSETRRELAITIDCKAYTDMVGAYRFNREQETTLLELMKPDYTLLWEAAVGRALPDGPSQEEIGDILDRLPAGLDVKRQSVIEAALSIQGQVHYFWGGKSSAIGWDDRWGRPAKVTAPGEDSTGTTRPFGLDCSGYVAWAFINGGQASQIGAATGFNTSDQWRRSQPLNWSAAEPGDLVFFAPPGERQYNHVGIIIGEEGGDYLVAHCASGQNNVVVTSAKGAGFRYARRPVVYLQNE